MAEDTIKTRGIIYRILDDFSSDIKRYCDDTNADLKSMNFLLRSMSGAWRDSGFSEFEDAITPSLKDVKSQLDSLGNITVNLDRKAEQFKSSIERAERRLSRNNKE